MSSAFVPGRANLIGEHLDYNEGAALPFAIQFGVSAVATASDDAVITVHSDGYGRWQSDEDTDREWTRLASCVIEYLGAHHVRLDVSSTLPAGAGLSSSAAYVGALSLALGASGGLVEVARFVQDCERRAGHDVGLLDQLATLGARRGHGLLIDFATNEMRDIKFPDSLAFSAVDTSERRQLATTQYALRRSECEQARALIGSLRHATLNNVSSIKDPLVRRRAHHVVSEFQRVLDTVSALSNDDVHSVGELVSASHWSLSREYEVSTPTIDELVSYLCRQQGVYGARLVGGGFGGCILVVHEPGLSRAFDTLTHWPLEVASGAFERLERPREFTV
jgi:galactokinase